VTPADRAGADAAPNEMTGRAVRDAPHEARRRLGWRGELALVALPTVTVLVVLALVEALARQRLLFASLASSAFLIYLDPTHPTNRVRTSSSRRRRPPRSGGSRSPSWGRVRRRRHGMVATSPSWSRPTRCTRGREHGAQLRPRHGDSRPLALFGLALASRRRWSCCSTGSCGCWRGSSGGG
jgi:hypothetical protein